MGAVIGGIISALVPLCAIGGALLWFGYWVIKRAVKNGIIEAAEEIEDSKNRQKEDRE